MDLEANRRILKRKENCLRVTWIRWLTRRSQIGPRWLLHLRLLTCHLRIGLNTLSVIQHTATHILRQTVRHPITASRGLCRRCMCPFAGRRHCSSFVLETITVCLRPLPPLFITAMETIVVCLCPLPPSGCAAPPLFAALCRCLENHHCLPSPAAAVQPSPMFVIASLKRTYKVWNASLEWQRAGIGYELRAFEAKLQRRRQELTQATPNQTVDDEAVYYNVVGECPKGQVYGLGSLGGKNRRYADPGASTSQLPEMVPRSKFDSVAKQLR
ncbi:hypothetical protein Syun_012728 [Stephania yunnanensis]|uniref:Uncharacterized protein n=1 Tax=Stephania yunnanensis TaxID=152371 RepID=A0AAP0K1C3_9MAGN